MAAELGMVLGNLVERAGNRARDVDSRSLRVGAGPARAPAQTDRARDLPHQELDLLLQRCGAAGVVARLGFLQLAAQIGKLALVVRNGLRVEYLTGVTEVSPALLQRLGWRSGRLVSLATDRVDQIDRVERLPGMA